MEDKAHAKTDQKLEEMEMDFQSALAEMGVDLCRKRN